MSELTIQEQARLPFRRCVGLVLSGIRFRLFRASVTVSIVALAVAFLATIAGEAIISRSVSKSLGEMTRPRQVFLFWTDYLSTPMEVAAVVERLRGLQPGEARCEELRVWGGCDAAALAGLIDLALREHRYVTFFDGLEEGLRRPLVGRLRGREALAALRTPDAWAALERAMDEGVVLPPTPGPALQAFLDDWVRTEPLRMRIAAGHRQSVANAARIFGARPVLDVLATADPALPALLAEAGFSISAADFATVCDGARFALRVQRLERLLNKPALRQRFVSRFELKDVKDLTLTRFYEALASKNGSVWLVEQLRDLKENVSMSVDEVRETARMRLAQDRLTTMEAAVAEAGSQGEGGVFGLSLRVLALIVVSLLVCVVGIINAMLMSVTERFTEIATMKCLGATDGVVMANFMLEAGFQGVVGGCIGGVMGVLLGLLRSALVYGALALRHLPVMGLTVTFAIIVVIGIILSVVAAVYPAWLAARLSPMEAMRVE